MAPKKSPTTVIPPAAPKAESKPVAAPASTPAVAAPAAKPVSATTAPATPVASPVIMAPKPATAPAAATATAVAAAPTAVATPARTEGARDRSTIIALIAKLRDHDAEIARDAAATLGSLPADAEAVDALAEVLRNRDGYFHSVVRTSAAASLGKLADRRALDALTFATNDNMAEASEEAVKALGLLGDPRALPTLHAVVQNTTGFFLENVRRTAQQAIAQIVSQNPKK